MTNKRIFFLISLILGIIGLWIIAKYTCWQVSLGVFITHWSINADKASRDA
jgi:hypothetical protein